MNHAQNPVNPIDVDPDHAGAFGIVADEEDVAGEPVAATSPAISCPGVIGRSWSSPR
jgi:hypothetical protein